MATTEYSGKYKKLFPGILSSNTLITVYTLHLLKQKRKMYGKEIADGIGDRLNNTWQPSHGLVYPLLRKMEELELIQGVWEGDGSKKTKRFYMITSKGEEALQKETNRIRPLLESSRDLIDIAIDDLCIMA